MNGSYAKGSATKYCPNKRCLKSDQTDFSKCRYCGAFYNAEKNEPVGGRPSAMEGSITKNIIGIFVCTGLVGWFVYASYSLNFNSDRWKHNEGNARLEMVGAVRNKMYRQTGHSGDKGRKWVGINQEEALEILGKPDKISSKLLHKTYPAVVWSYVIPVKDGTRGYLDVWFKDGSVEGVAQE